MDGRVCLNFLPNLSFPFFTHLLFFFVNTPLLVYLSLSSFDWPFHTIFVFFPISLTLHNPVSPILNTGTSIILNLIISLNIQPQNYIFNLLNPFMNLLMDKFQEEGSTKYKYKIYQYKSIQLIANFSFPALKINKSIIGKQFCIHRFLVALHSM